jgi:hypothetical protein
MPTARHRDALARGIASLGAIAVATLGLAAAPVRAATDKLLLTGGVTSIDGAGGGGLTPWALIGSNATEGEVGGTATLTDVSTKTYNLHVIGAALAVDDRAEISVAHQDFDTGSTGAALGLPALHLQMDVVGAKVRVAGDAVLDSDSPMPQVAVGAEYKALDAGGLAPTLGALGARTHGTDWYVSATKLFLAQGLLVNATLRLTKANQNGLLGFGGTAHEGYSLQPEFSAAWLASRTLAFGAEYRFKPDNLNPSALGAGLKENDWFDAFVAWAPTKHVSLTAAVVDLGRIVPAVAAKTQAGGYLSGQLAF